MANAAWTHPEHELVSVNDSVSLNTMEGYLDEPDSAMIGVPGPFSGTYRHRLLCDPRNEIRLITLLPRMGGRDVRIKMARASLFQPLDFEALSYTWGDPLPIETIHIESQPFHVKKPLFDALLALRLPETRRYLWIDAICIDQSNNDEKSRQVQRMKDIYNKVSRVLIWLGPESEDSSLAIELMSTNESASSHLHSDEAWMAVDRLACRPWWNRLWCLQEVVSAEADPVVMCGDKTISWSVLVYQFRGLPVFRLDIGEGLLGYWLGRLTDLPYQRLDAVRDDHWYSPSLDFFDLLSTTLDFKTCDPQDKVFALMGLTGISQRETIIPDYSQNTGAVYIKTAMQLMKSSLNCLTFNTNSPNQAFEGGQLPSWVPNWSLGASRPSTLWKPNIYHASSKDDDLSKPRPQIRPSADGAVINVMGYVVERIACISEVIIPDNTWIYLNSTSMQRTIKEIEVMMGDFVKNSSMTPESTAALDLRKSDMLWRTLIADRCPDPKFVSPAHEEWGEDFETLYDQFSSIQGVNASDLQPSSSDKVGDDPMYRKPAIQPQRQGQAQYIAMTRFTLQNRRVFITEHGRLGIGSSDIEQGDMAAVLIGADVPFVLRPAGKDPNLRLISEAYVHTIMRGEILKQPEPRVIIFPIC